MNGSDRQRAEQLFQILVDLPPDERARYLDEHCADDPAILAEVEALLRAHDANNGAFLDEPAIEVATSDTSPGETKGSRRRVTVDDDWTGRQIGRYTLTRKVGEGGMGVVYEAQQTEPIRRTVAIKLIKLGMDSKQVIARFESERQALALLDHPNIAHIHDAGTTDDGRPYFVMEYVPGPSLTEYCDARRLDIDTRLKLFMQVCQGVQHAHQKGIIHRDIKPANVRVLADGDKPVPKIIDFGVAKAIERALTERTLVTEHGQFIGTPEYMSPEQATMDGELDGRTDVYSLGVLLYKLLTGVLPFEVEIIRRNAIGDCRCLLLENDPPLPASRFVKLGEQTESIAESRGTNKSKLLRQLRGDLGHVVLKALDRQRLHRYATPQGLCEDINRYLIGQRVNATVPTFRRHLQSVARRYWRAVFYGLNGAILMSLIFLSSSRIRDESSVPETPLARQITLTVTSLEEDSMLAFLAKRGAKLVEYTEGHVTIHNTSESRTALSDWMRFQRLRLETIAGNLANRHATYNMQGHYEPYRRRAAQIDKSGIPRVVTAPNPLKMIFDPEHPHATANGFIWLPNVDPAKERADVLDASRQHDRAASILVRFAPSIVVDHLPEIEMMVEAIKAEMHKNGGSVDRR